MGSSSSSRRVVTSDSSSVRFPTTSLQSDTRSSRWSWRHSSSCPASVFSLHHFPRSVIQRLCSSGSSFTSSALWWRILCTSTLQSLESCKQDNHDVRDDVRNTSLLLLKDALNWYSTPDFFLGASDHKLTVKGPKKKKKWVQVIECVGLFCPFIHHK